MERLDVILPLVQDKRVLDCGGVDHDNWQRKMGEGTWLHEDVRAAASECVGVDIMAENVARLNSSGYRFIHADVEELRLDERFDVVLGGEIIEHLLNPGRFLRSAFDVLEPGGRLILTTPNAYSPPYFIKAVVFGRETVHPEHTAMYTPQTLSYLVERCGFDVLQCSVVHRRARSVVLDRARRALGTVRPLSLHTIVLVAERPVG